MDDNMKIRMLRILVEQTETFIQEENKLAKGEKNKRMASYYAGKRDAYYLMHRWLKRDILGEPVSKIEFFQE